MSPRQITVRLLAGLALSLALLAVLFAITLPIIHRWGATDAELALRLPGDELLTNPLIEWTHGLTIDAPPEQVWPWIAQIGDTRAGYYSYTFIENQVAALTGADDYAVTYVNADRVHPEWQNPQPGQAIIQGVLQLRAVEPGAYLLAASISPEAFDWVWLWQVQPAGDGNQTRLRVRFGIDLPGEDSHPLETLVMDMGGFMMEQRMLQGIKLRAEGGREPVWMEKAEVALWLAALMAGLAAAVAYMVRPNWQRPLAVAVAAVVALFVLTFVQPALWLRVLVDAGLIAGLVWAWGAVRPEAWAGWLKSARLPASVLVMVAALLMAACQPLDMPEATPNSPLPLQIKWPASGEAIEASPLLQWESFPGATHYHVTVIGSDPAVSVEQDTVHALIRVSPPLPKGATYAWEVQAQDARHTVLAELNSQFFVLADLVPTWPPDREAVDTMPVLQWQAFPGAAVYHVTIVDEETSPPEVVVDQVVDNTSYAVSTPLAPGNYGWTVQALATNQQAVAAFSHRFRVINHLELLEPPDGGEVGASPTIRWASFPGATQYQVIVLDADAYPPATVVDRVTKGTEFVVSPPLKPENGYSLTIRAMDRGRTVLAESSTMFRVYPTGPFFDCNS